MPELPEVETVCRGLEPIIVNKRFENVIANRQNLRIPLPENLGSALIGREVVSIKRRAKYMLITLDNHMVLMMHLGMSGKVLVKPYDHNDYTKHDHVIFKMDNQHQVIFNDPRRFGLITLTSHNALYEHPLLCKLGPEPLEQEFSAPYLQQALARKKAPIKTALMDNSIVVGVGNIYACESLFRSKVSPIRPANSLNQKELALCVKSIKDVLNEAIKSGGSTIRDYVRSSGDGGYFQHHFSVYGKKGMACNLCKNDIEQIKQAGRSTFYCPQCQT